jgi:hypothetical protein
MQQKTSSKHPSDQTMEAIAESASRTLSSVEGKGLRCKLKNEYWNFRDDITSG